MKCRFQVRDIGIIGEDILFVGEAISLPLALVYRVLDGRIGGALLRSEIRLWRVK